MLDICKCLDKFAMRLNLTPYQSHTKYPKSFWFPVSRCLMGKFLFAYHFPRSSRFPIARCLMGKFLFAYHLSRSSTLSTGITLGSNQVDRCKTCKGTVLTHQKLFQCPVHTSPKLFQCLIRGCQCRISRRIVEYTRLVKRWHCIMQILLPYLTHN